ncbi:Protein tpx2 [Coemansia sp. RSA 2704]|nr:Protein tpx2 [Coemansia sp. RSA 2704]
MTKSRRSSQRKSGASKRDHAETPARSQADDVWNFDAPQFFDFASTKTPGPTVDRWFDYAHPTPAPKRASRPSTDSLFSTHSRDSLLPTRPSLSPSRLVVGADGRLTLDEGQSQGSASDATEPGQSDIQDVVFSDTDEEIEFNNWRSAQVLANIDNNNDNNDEDTGTASLEASRKDPRSSEASTASMVSETSMPDDGQPEAQDNAPLRIAATKGGGRISKKAVRPVSGATKTGSALTVPVELGYMRSTQGASRRQLAKQRDKKNKQMIAQVIAKSINRRLSHDNKGGLTVPKPFKFHERQTGGSLVQEAAGTEKKAVRLNKEAQEYLVAKLAAKRKSVESPIRESSRVRQSDEGTPPRLAKKLKPTVPQTPQFAKSKRIRREMPATEAAAAAAAAPKPVKRIAVTSKPAAAHLSPPKPTIPKPFTFRSDAAAERHLHKLREELAKLREEEEEMRQFRAQPLPEFPTPKKTKRLPSELHASPFSLATDSRGEAYQQKLRARLEELEQRQRERQQFKARPIPASIDHPFVPQASTLPLTEIEEILLRTELRSEERHAYDEDRAERERIREEVLARKRQEEERREEEEIKRLRKLLVHKAQPVRHYKPTVINPSDRPLTVPKTPKWNVRTRKLGLSIAPTH